MNVNKKETKLNFEFIKEIGSEGMNSRVYIAHDKQFDADIVVKKMLKESFENKEEFFNEAKCLYVSSHENVVDIYYASEDDDFIYVAMPFYKNGSLQSLMEKRTLTVREIIKYSLDFLSGLNHIHSKGLIHFDIKPNNILLSNANEAMVTDFGLTKFTNHLRIAEQYQFYQPHMAPECIDQTMFSAQVDIYSAGMTIYRMCNLHNVLDKQLATMKSMYDFEQKIKLGKFPDRKIFNPHIPTRLRKVILKALALNPSDRYNNLIEMMNDLSMVNENLDWNFDPEAAKWTLVKETKTIEVTLSKNDEGYLIETLKTTHSSARVTKERKHCFEKQTKASANKKLMNIFRAY